MLYFWRFLNKFGQLFVWDGLRIPALGRGFHQDLQVPSDSMILGINLGQLKTGPAFLLLVLVGSEEASMKSMASYHHAAFKGLSSESVEVPIASYHLELCFLTAFPLLFFQLWIWHWKEEDIIAP